MDTRLLIGIFAAGLAIVSLGGVLFTLFSGSRESDLQALLRTNRGGGMGTPREAREAMQGDTTGKEYERLKKLQKKRLKSAQEKVGMEELYFHAGIFSKRDRREFERLRVLIPAIMTPVFLLLGWTSFGSAEFALYFGIIGLLVALKAPSTILNKKIKNRGEDIMFFLPLVIEQIAIGVSSSLDIGPCLQRVVAMADERDSHNVVTELVRHAQYHIKSGVSLEEALVEVGTRSGHIELKHTFMALAQVAKHGGEISKQLMELADAVASQRETRVEAKIKKLELEATGPVALVFLGFIIILLVGFGIQIKDAF